MGAGAGGEGGLLIIELRACRSAAAGWSSGPCYGGAEGAGANPVARGALAGTAAASVFSAVGRPARLTLLIGRIGPGRAMLISKPGGDYSETPYFFQSSPSGHRHNGRADHIVRAHVTQGGKRFALAYGRQEVRGVSCNIWSRQKSPLRVRLQSPRPAGPNIVCGVDGEIPLVFPTACANKRSRRNPSRCHHEGELRAAVRGPLYCGKLGRGKTRRCIHYFGLVLHGVSPMDVIATDMALSAVPLLPR